jgi:hypothetical protein
MTRMKKTLSISALSLLATACGTQQTPQTFRLLPVQQKFDLESARQQFQAAREINTQVDLLWIVDNSSSMEPSQKKLREGFKSFARKYMKPGWDIRSAVITTDTYVANTAFAPYLGSVIQGSQGYKSKYLARTLEQGIRFNEKVPSWGPSYARLLPGIHDGPIPAMCFELNDPFFNGATRCAVRDRSKNQGPASCLEPGAGENSVTQCVNTLENNSIHSGRAIISTMPPAGVAADDAWAQKLTEDFILNVSVGAAGLGSERGFQSVFQLMQDNEPTPTRFFRKGALHILVFVSDEDDQSMDESAQAKLLADPAMAAKGPYAGYSASNCQTKTVDGYSYKLSECVDASLLMPVKDVKSRLDSFFASLDGKAQAEYRVAAITLTSGASIQANQEALDKKSGFFSHDAGARYLELARLAGEDSPVLDISRADYTPILDKIGAAVVDRITSFDLDHEPSKPGEVKVRIVRADGSAVELKPGQFVVKGRKLSLTDPKAIALITSKDRISIEIDAQTVFRLEREPGAKEYVRVSIRRASGSVTQVRPDQFLVQGLFLSLTDPALIAGLASNDQVDIRYEPKTAN